MSRRHGDTGSQEAVKSPACNAVRHPQNTTQQIRDQLQASQIHFSKIIELSTDAIISVDSLGRITLFNTGAEQMFGYPAARIMGRPLELLIPKRLRGRHRGHIAAFIADKGGMRRMGQRGEILARRRGGAEFPAEASIMHYDIQGVTV